VILLVVFVGAPFCLANNANPMSASYTTYVSASNANYVSNDG